MLDNVGFVYISSISKVTDQSMLLIKKHFLGMARKVLFSSLTFAWQRFLPSIVGTCDMYILRLCKSVAVGILFAVALQTANANLVTNGSFEMPLSVGSPSLPTGSTYLQDWTVIIAEIAHIFPGAFGVIASDGDYSLDLSGYHDSIPYGGVRQVINTTPGAVYNISFDVGSMLADSAVLVSAGDLFSSGTSTATLPTGVTWTTFTSSFTAQGATTDIDLIGVLSDAGNYIGLDNVVVTLASLPNNVPEPGTLLLVSAGLLTLGGLRRAHSKG